MPAGKRIKTTKSRRNRICNRQFPQREIRCQGALGAAGWAAWAGSRQAVRNWARVGWHRLALFIV